MAGRRARRGPRVWRRAGPRFGDRNPLPDCCLTDAADRAHWKGSCPPARSALVARQDRSCSCDDSRHDGRWRARRGSDRRRRDGPDARRCGHRPVDGLLCRGRRPHVTHDFRYALVMLAAIVVMSLLLRRWQAKLPLAWWEKLGIGVGGFCGAMIGAKLPFVLSDWTGLVSGTAWLSDGKTILCGIVGGYLGVEVAKWTLDIRIKTGDTFAVPVAVAVAIGRV